MSNSWEFKIIDPLRFVVPKQTVHSVFIHCSASDNAALRGVSLAEEIERWHLQNKWSGIGYHEVIDKEGVVVSGRPAEIQGAAQLGKDGNGNVGAYAICVHGNWNFSEASLEALVVRARAIHDAFTLEKKQVRFRGHCEIDPKPCPVFDYRKLLGLDDRGHFNAGVSDPVSIVAAMASKS